MRLGVFVPNWIGDVVMATPALRALRKLVGEDGRLVGIMRPYVAEVLDGTSWLDEKIVYDKPRSRFAMATREVYDQLRAARLDRVVLLTNSSRTAWMAWRSGARERIGYAYGLLIKRVPRPRTADGRLAPTLDAYRHLAEAAGAAPESPRLELATTAADERAADAVWQRLGLPAGEQVVILNSGGAYGAAKRWPAEHFAELARRIVHDSGERLAVVINCGPAERALAREIAARAGHPRVVSLADCDELPIGLTKACIRRGRMLVTTDSGPRFLAIAFGKPVVSLFGPTDPAATKTYYDRETCLSLALECQPCMSRTCPLGHHRCMRELSVERVLAAVVDQLGESILKSGRVGEWESGRNKTLAQANLPLFPSSSLPI
jgi:heptosyltransferase-2